MIRSANESVSIVQPQGKMWMHTILYATPQKIQPLIQNAEKPLKIRRCSTKRPIVYRIHCTRQKGTVLVFLNTLRCISCFHYVCRLITRQSTFYFLQ